MSETKKFFLLPRGVALDENDRIAAVGCPANLYPGKRRRVLELPTDHYDFPGPVNVEGLTMEEAKQVVKEFMQSL